MQPTRGIVAAVTTALLVGPAACTSSGPSAADAASGLASALTDGRLVAQPFAGATGRQAQRSWDRVVDGLGDARHRVEVGSVSGGSDGKPAVARLSWTWTLPGSDRTWSYTSTARLREHGDAWQTLWEPTLLHPSLRAGERLEVGSTAAERADILGAGGTPLVTARRVYRFGIDKVQVSPARAVVLARRLATAVGVDATPYARQVREAGERAFVEAIVLRPSDARPVLATGVADLEGVGVVSDRVPLAPTREFARPLLGTVGPVTAEIVEQSHGGYAAGDEAGLSGLEQRYDEQLRGEPGLAVRAVSPDGHDRRLFSVDPQPGRPLRTTLDRRLQLVAEDAVADLRPASAVVVVRPSDGDVLAAASGPGGGGLNTATDGRYAPGSTFKVVSSLALLRAGLTPDSTVSCPATTVVDGKSFKNYSDYPPRALGRIPLRSAVANSCNTAFITERDRVSQADVADAAASLGLGVDHDLGFPAYFGSVPATAADAGSETGHAASLIGQGKVTASPMAMAAVAASVAAGHTVVPRLLPDQPVDNAAATPPLRRSEARVLFGLMRGVVTSGSGTFLAALPGPPVVAKTGTAEFGTAEPLRTHAWMIAAQGDLAVAVFVDVGESGSQTAGPVLERFLRAAR